MWFLRPDTLLVMLALGMALSLAHPFFQGLPKHVRLLLLVAVNVLFIAWIGRGLLLFYLLYTAMIYGFSLLIARIKGVGIRRVLFAGGALFCLLPLFTVRLWESSQLFLIIGLAFALLRGIDVLFYAYYVEEAPRPLSLFNFMLFVPTFTAGPVFRYRDFDRACDKPKTITFVDLIEALKRMVRGFFQVIVAAQLLQRVFDHFLAGYYHLPISVLLVMCSWLILFFNLNGYTDIAIGLGRLWGFVVPENFKKPWKAASFTLFWRSWHATVSDWIREHVTILLHKQKINRLQGAGTALVIMVIMALWHGFSVPSFILGLYLGLLLAAENLLGLTSPGKKWTAVRVLRCFVVNFLFGINTLFFLTDFDSMLSIVRGLFRLW